MRTFPYVSLLASLLLALSCNTTKPVAAPPPPAPDVTETETETRNLDTMTVTPEANGVIEEEDIVAAPDSIPTRRPPVALAFNRISDLLHTKLELRFDWDQEMVIGKATLRLRPVFSPVRSVVLDAKGLDFKLVTNTAGRELKYSYDEEEQKVTIELDQTYVRGEDFTVVLDYTAIPHESGTAGGGPSRVIRDYFSSILAGRRAISRGRSGRRGRRKTTVAGSPPSINPTSGAPRSCT